MPMSGGAAGYWKQALTGAQLEAMIEALGSGEHLNVYCNWSGEQVRSIDLPDISSSKISLIGRGKTLTTLKGVTNNPILKSAKTSWDNTAPMIELKDMNFEADSDMSLNLPFWIPRIKHVQVGGECNSNAKHIIFGGSGAPACPAAYIEDLLMKHQGGVTTNSYIRSWLENVIFINPSIVLQDAGGGDVGNWFELMGTKCVIISPVIHQWQGRNVTESVFKIAGDEQLTDILGGVYINQSGGSASEIAALLKINSGCPDSRFNLYGNILMPLVNRALKNIYADAYTCIRSNFNGIFAKDEYALPTTQSVQGIRHATSTSSIVLTDALLTNSGQNPQAVDLRKWNKMIIEVIANSAGNYTTEVHAYNETNSESLGFVTWSGTAQQSIYSDPISLIGLTNKDGIKQVSMYVKTSNAGGTTLYFANCIFHFFR